MKQITTKSGIKGWQSLLQVEYTTFEEFEQYDEVYNLAKRLGFEDANEAWEANPTIQGSTNPEDFCVAPEPYPIGKEDEKFTGGEWVNGSAIYDAHSNIWKAPIMVNTNQWVAHGYGSSHLEAEANAKLIASAPTLYRDNARLLRENEELKKQFNESVNGSNLTIAGHLKQKGEYEAENKELREALQDLVKGNDIGMGNKAMKLRFDIAKELLNRI